MSSEIEDGLYFDKYRTMWMIFYCPHWQTEKLTEITNKIKCHVSFDGRCHAFTRNLGWGKIIKSSFHRTVYVLSMESNCSDYSMIRGYAVMSYCPNLSSRCSDYSNKCVAMLVMYLSYDYYYFLSQGASNLQQFDKSEVCCKICYKICSKSILRFYYSIFICMTFSLLGSYL